MFVVAGFIVGFDTEKGSIAAGMIDCIEATNIPVCMIGLLTALPDTQLTHRLQAEKRLLPLLSHKGDQCLAGLNFVTLRARRDILTDYKTVLLAVYEPSAYFLRVRAVGRALRPLNLPVKFNAKMALRDLTRLLRLMWRMTVRCPDLRRHFWETLVVTACRNPRALQSTISLMVFYLHLGAFSQQLIRDLDKQITVSEPDWQPHLTAAWLTPNVLGQQG